MQMRRSQSLRRSDGRRGAIPLPFVMGLLLGLSGTPSAGPPVAAQASAAPPTPGQSPDVAAETATGDFFDVVDVEIVNVDVWVTDKDGQPVEGLTKDDFVVRQDGAPVEITNFYAVASGRPAIEAPAEEPVSVAEPEDLPLLAPRGADQPQIAPEHRLWLILFIDNFDIDPIERNRVLPQLARFMSRTLREGDQAMLVTYDRSLEVRHPFTDDVELLLTALGETRKDSGLAEIRTRDQMATLRRIDQASDASQALLYARQYAEEQMNSVGFTVDALERLIESLAGLPGRKALVHVSSGIPLLAGEEAFHAVGEKFGTSEAYAEIPRHDNSRAFERVDRKANAHRVTFYTVDAGGLQGIEFGAAEYGGFVHPKLRRTLDTIVPENFQSPLRLMALETGGRAIVNRNDILPALEEAAEDFRSFYSLGIQAAGDGGDRYHRIEVRLREPRRGVDVRHRAGYRSKSADTRVRESLRSALLYAHQDNPLDVAVRLGRAEPYGGSGNYLLPIELKIPLRQAVLLPIGDGRHEARLKLFVGAVDEGGGTSEIDSAPLSVRLADEHVEAAKAESLVHVHKLLLSPGKKKVGVAIFDLFGRDSSIVTRFVQVGPAAEEPG